MSGKANVKVTIHAEYLKELDEAAQRALEQTAEMVHGEVEQAQVIPYGNNIVNKDGSEIHHGGHLQGDSTFVDSSDLANGHVDLVSSTPYARRLYYHPEYRFNRENNVNAGAGWFDDWAEGGANQNFAEETFAAIFKREAGL